VSDGARSGICPNGPAAFPVAGEIDVGLRNSSITNQMTPKRANRRLFACKPSEYACVTPFGGSDRVE
jgi:hypothetical protein